MALATLPSSAQIETLIQAPELLERIRSLEERSATINGEIDTLRGMLENVLGEKQEAVDARQQVLSPASLDDLENDISYSADEVFEPSDTDVFRRETFQNRQNVNVRMESDARLVSRNIDLAKAVIKQLPDKIAGLEYTMARATESFGAKLKDFFTGASEEAERALPGLRQTLADAEARLPKLTADLKSAEEKLAAIRKNASYDRNLHAEDVRSAELLPRTEQSVLLSFSTTHDDYLRRRENKRMMTISLPAVPGDADMTVTLNIDLLDDRDAKDFIRLIGPKLQIDGLDLEDVMPFNAEFEDKLLPLALEIVEMADGQRKYRLPRAVWERFQNQIS